MHYQVREDSGYSVVALSGDVDLSSSPQARGAILKALNAGDHVLIDLSGVEYIDSSGVACLVEGYQLARSRGQRFGLVGVSENAMSVLALARLDKVFPIHASVAARVAADA